MAPRTTITSFLMLLASAALALRASRAVALGVVLGGLWSLLNLWALRKTLALWLTEAVSHRRMIGWILVKFPLLYGLLIAMLAHPTVSPVGVGLGITIVLIALAVAGILSASRTPEPAPGHGR